MTRIDTSSFERSHGRAPRGHGTWIFEGRDGRRIERVGTFTEAKRALPAGEFVVLP